MRQLSKGFSFILLVLLIAFGASALSGQDTVTGAFEGIVSDSLTGAPLKGAQVDIINQATGITRRLVSDYRGRFYQGLLIPGTYLVRISLAGYQTREVPQRLRITYAGEVVPIPVALDPTPTGAPPTAAPTQPVSVSDTDVRSSILRIDGRRSGSFSEDEVVSLPLGGVTITRTFDELALLLPGVAPPPQTIGNVAGPGVGPGVGSAGQFAVNGLRSRGNNFTVDGSDNNDEDIGVRRQGFVALVPQSLESIQEYQVISLLAPAQFGRNLGAQVNAVSKSGGSKTHGTFYGNFNSSQLNSRNVFDTSGGNAIIPVRAGSQPVIVRTRSELGQVSTTQPLSVQNQSGGKDTFTFGQFGFVLGGPLDANGQKDKSPHRFYFISAEGYVINATKEESFAVPTVGQRGAFGSAATGIFSNPFTGDPTVALPTGRSGSAIFSLFPFPNNPLGVYGINTFTSVLPEGGRGKVFSTKLDDNFKVGGRDLSITGRYNFAEDFRDIPSTGQALFSSLRPRVRAQNFSLFQNSEVSNPKAPTAVFNQLRLSYGRTRLNFEEVPDRQFLLPSSARPGEPFLLNALLFENFTAPPSAGVPNTGPLFYDVGLAYCGPAGNRRPCRVEDVLGFLGQVNVAGFSPVGVDVYNFPQRRVNNTYQIADEMTVQFGNHHAVLGTDNRRTEFNSDLPRNARPIVTFGGSPRLIVDGSGGLRFPNPGDANALIRPEDLVSIDAASNFFLTLNTGRENAHINLRYYQLNFYAQDQWRVRNDLSLSAGLRYEYNTPPRETSRLIENTFNDPALNLVPGLRQFIGGRDQIFSPDRNNFAPRIGLAYSPDLFRGRASVFRGGYGVFYDQIPGAVVSQSRNVYPTFLTLNFGGIRAATSNGDTFLSIFNPAATFFRLSDGRAVSLIAPGTANRFNPEIPLGDFLSFLNGAFPDALGVTLPVARLRTPVAHHYSLTFEQQINAQTTLSLAYTGTVGHYLLRSTTPNLGPAITIAPTAFTVITQNSNPPIPRPQFLGRVNLPGRPVAGVGAVNLFDSTARSRYNSFQLQLRGRLRPVVDYQLAYTLGRANDDVSDVFELAGAPALPQNSLTFAGEWGPANFDVRHRLSYSLSIKLPPLQHKLARSLADGLQVISTGTWQTGQPFTVNSIFDINLDGNLTDRLDTTNGLLVTGDRRQPLKLKVVNPLGLLAPFGRDGRIGRNTFRAGNVLDLNLSVDKRLRIMGTQNLSLRVDVFNFINRANFGVPVRWLEAPGFGQATTTVTPARRLQFGLKYSF